ncbi:MAG TPA: tetratricopeptide repeat protein, partial [Thermoanaerobaculia bacterium]|nr:tetratricopeptide repeat protein [Thermoanaerobaculia bacterium]
MTACGVFEAFPFEARSRYPGTAPFSDSPSDRARFFGREEEADQLYLRVLSVPLLVQFGKSGLGKTSLLQAGLFPRLRDRGKAFLPVMVRLNEPGRPLVAAVLRSFEESCAAEGLELNVGEASGLWELLTTTIVWRGDLLLTPVLVFDQFEEVFTLHDAAFREEVAAELGAVAAGIPPRRLQNARSSARPEVKVVISLREDYLGALEEFSSAIPGLFQERLRLEAMGESAAREAITRPARLVADERQQPYGSPPFELDPAALDRMIAFLKGSSGVIEPFQLQLLCRRAERLAVRQQRETGAALVTLTANEFGETQQFEAVLKNFYRDTLAKVSPPQQRARAARLCEEGLLGGSGHRLMLEETQIRDTYGVSEDTLAMLARERLVVREPRHESVFYEISHDRLAESIFSARRRKVPARVRKWLWAAALVVVLVVAALVQWNRAVAARSRAVQTERDRAELLLSFLLGEDFLGQVRDSGRSTMLAQVHAHVGEGGGTERNRALALRGAAELHMVQGKLTEAVKSYRQALAMFERAGNDPATTRDIARSHERLALALEQARRFREAREHYDAADAAWVRVAATGAATQEDCLARAEMLTSSAYAKHQMGDQALVTADLDKAVAIVFDILFGGKTHCAAAAARTQPYPPTQALVVLSDVAGLRSFQFDENKDADAAVRLLEEARRQSPASASIRQQMIAAIANRGSARISAQAALDDYRAALAEAEELRRWDPENRIWQRERVASQLLVSEAVIRCNSPGEGNDCKAPTPSLGEAEAITLDALAVLQTLVALEPSNPSVQSYVSWALQNLAHIRAAEGRRAESLSRLAEAEAVLRSLLHNQSDAEAAVLDAALLLEIADTLDALGRGDEAATVLRSAIGMFDRLLAAHAGNHIYLTYLKDAHAFEAKLCRKRGDADCAAAAEEQAARADTSLEAISGRWLVQYDELWNRDQEEYEKASKLLDQRDFSAALAKLRASEAATREHLRFDPTLYGWYVSLRFTYDAMATAYEGLRDDAGYNSALVAQMNAAQMAAWLAPDDTREEADRELVRARLALGEHLRASSPKESLAMFQEVVGALERLAATSPLDAEIAGLLGRAKCTAGQVRRETRSAGWEEEVRSGLIDLRRATELAKNNGAAFKTLGLWHLYLAQELPRGGGSHTTIENEKTEAVKALRRA